MTLSKEHQQIYEAIAEIRDRIVAIETRQEERHQQNRKDLNGLGDFTRKVAKLDTDVAAVKTHQTIQWFFVGAIVLSLLSVAVRVFAS